MADRPLWQPSPERIRSANLTRFAAHVAERLARQAPPGTVAETTIARDLQASLEALARDRALLIGSGASIPSSTPTWYA